MADPPSVPCQIVRHHGADLQLVRRCLVCQLLDRIVASDGRVDVDVRQIQEQVEAVELQAIDFGRRRQVEHRVEVDRRLVARAALADNARPRRIMELRIVVGVFDAHGHPFL